MKSKRIITFGLTVFVLMNIASYIDGDFIDWGMNIAFLGVVLLVYFNIKYQKEG